MKRSRLALILYLPLIALFCLGAIFLVALPLTMPRLAADTFGPPAENLGVIDKVYLSSQILLERDTLTAPKNPFGAEVPFQIALGESPLAISNRLEVMGLIADPNSFRNYLVYSGLDVGLQAGDYVLSPIMSPVEIAQALQDPTPAEVDFVVLAGWRLEEIAVQLPASGLAIPPDTFISSAVSLNAEGYLHPGTYSVPREISVDLLLRTLVNEFHKALTPDLEAGFAQSGLTIPEAVILASIIEREAIVESEMPLIASVFINRLAVGMKLDADPTVQYAVGYNSAQGTWWTNPLSHADLATDSPYNTYLYHGLPPGPIANPGLTALQAVAYPAQSPYYYFRALCDNSGRHIFAQTYAEHVANACP